MSRFDELVAEHCPEGVPFKTLGEVGEFIRGNGLQKKDLTNSGVPAIHYGQVFTTYDTAAHETVSFTDPAGAKKLRRAKTGDLVVATTSENDADVCKAVAWLGRGEAAVSSDAFIYRHTLDPMFAAYLFQSNALDQQKRKYVSGTKVKRVSGTDLAKVRVPVPPLEVQQAVAGILDIFRRLEAELEAGLEAELESRKSQYLYYRDRLCSCEHAEVRTSTLAEIGTFFGGLTGKTKADFSAGGALYVPYTNIFSNLSVDFGTLMPVRIEADERQHALKLGDILFTGSSESRHEVGMTAVVTTSPAHPLFLNSFSIGYRLSDPSILDPEFAKHLFRSTPLRNQIIRAANGVTRFNVSKSLLGRVKLPLPPLEKQMQVAATLDRLYSLVHDLSSGLPDEIAARRKQYEYYRERLLTFKELEA